MATLASRRRTALAPHLGQEAVLALILVVALVVLAFTTDRFLTTANLLNQGRLMAEVGLVALPMTLIIGVIQLFAGFSLFAGGTYGRVIGIIAASLGALGALLAVGGAYPFWALGVFAICLWCIHGLIVLGEPMEEERLPGSTGTGAGAPRA